MLTLFCLVIFPMGPVYALAYVIIFYWIDKWWLLKVCKLPFNLSYEIVIGFVYFLDFSILSYAVTLYLQRQANSSSI